MHGWRAFVTFRWVLGARVGMPCRGGGGGQGRGFAGPVPVTV